MTMDARRAADLAHRCAEAGRDILGFGDAGIVLAGGPGWVLKFGYDGADGWPAWARWCMAEPGPHKPRVAALEVIQHRGAPVAFLAVMERLRPTLVAARWIKPDRLLKRQPFRLADMAERDGMPLLAAMLREAANRFPGARWDAAPSNWMERDDGTLVLTDPWARLDESAPAAQVA